MSGTGGSETRTVCGPFGFHCRTVEGDDDGGSVAISQLNQGGGDDFGYGSGFDGYYGLGGGYGGGGNSGAQANRK